LYAQELEKVHIAGAVAPVVKDGKLFLQKAMDTLILMKASLSTPTYDL
jgi:hypothetical protein